MAVVIIDIDTKVVEHDRDYHEIYRKEYKIGISEKVKEVTPIFEWLEVLTESKVSYYKDETLWMMF